MSARTPYFLLGGINSRMSIVGTRTARTSVYGTFETAVKLVPIVFCFGAAAQYKRAAVRIPAGVPEPEVCTQRRATLMQ